MTLEVAQVVMLEDRADVREHSFARTEHIPADAAVLSVMFAEMLDRARSTLDDEDSVVEFDPSVDDWDCRTIIPSATGLLERSTMTLVGFFGRVADRVEPSVVDRIRRLGEALAEAVLETPGVLGYSTHLLADERNYANLVLIDDPKTIAAWRTNAMHRVAAGDVAPDYYAHVRIYNGGATVAETPLIALHVVKYWDYRCRPVWHAMRAIS